MAKNDALVAVGLIGTLAYLAWKRPGTQPPQQGDVILKGSVGQVGVSNHGVSKFRGGQITVVAPLVVGATRNGAAVNWSYQAVVTVLLHSFPNTLIATKVVNYANQAPGAINLSVAVDVPVNATLGLYDVYVTLNAARNESGVPSASTYDRLSQSAHDSAFEVFSDEFMFQGSVGAIVVSQPNLLSLYRGRV